MDGIGMDGTRSQAQGCVAVKEPKAASEGNPNRILMVPALIILTAKQFAEVALELMERD
jgi:hypothetical protein